MTYDQWLKETGIIAQTYRDSFGREPAFTDVAHINYRRAFETNRWPRLEDALRKWTGLPPEPQPPVPPPTPPVPQHGQLWASYYDSLVDPRCNPKEFAKRLADSGCSGTRVWLWTAWAFNQGGTGQFRGFCPWMQRPSGPWDLETVDPYWLERVGQYVDAMNAAGILPQLCGLTLYDWSRYKAGMLWVPDQSKLWFQHNIQGIYYYEDDALTEKIASGVGAHAFLGQTYEAAVDTLLGLRYEIELGNEMPEKGLHERLKKLWRDAGYHGPFQVNRNSDTPGQYDNMSIGKPAGYDKIAFHGKRDLSYLDEEYPDEAPAGRPTTFRKFYATNPNPKRITISSDGCRVSASDIEHIYDYDKLAEVAKDAIARGFIFEHQSRLKMRNFLEGRIDLADLETEWLKGLVK